MNEENELNVSAIFKSIIDSRNFIILVSALFSTIALVYSLTLNNVYESKIELKYTDTMTTNREGSGLSFWIRYLLLTVLRVTNLLWKE